MVFVYRHYKHRPNYFCLMDFLCGNDSVCFSLHNKLDKNCTSGWLLCICGCGFWYLIKI